MEKVFQIQIDWIRAMTIELVISTLTSALLLLLE
jgi:hypothetical protein